MKLPTLREITVLHQKYAPSPEVLDLVFTHCQIVDDIAEQLIQTSGAALDVELVRIGCLLHDIGVYPLFDKDGNERKDVAYITHGVLGETILKDEGFPEAIWRFASHHTGVGLTRHDIEDQDLPLPLEDYEAGSVEERLIMYADKFHSKSSPPSFNSYAWYRWYVQKFGEDKATKFERMAEEFGIPDLQPLIKKYEHQERS